MSTSYSPKIITDGLVMCLDAGNIKSYASGSGTWYDLITPSYSGSLINGPTFSASNKGVIVLDGVNDRVEVSNTGLDIGGKPPNCTLSFWLKATRKNDYIQPAGFRNQFGIFDFYFLVLDSGGATVNTEARLTTTDGTYDLNVNFLPYFGNWTNITFAAYSTYTQLFFNGNLAGTRSSVTGNFGASSSKFAIGANVAGSAFWTSGSIGSVMLYNRGLSGQEILQNYNSTKGRYGL